MNERLVLRQLFDSNSSTYTYLLADRPSGKGILIDPVFDQHLRDLALLRELEIELVATVDTHCHADHVTGAWMMQQATGCRIAISARYRVEGADLRVDDGDRIEFGSRSLEVRATPGHTSGCITLVLDDAIAFTGDALLIRGAGRCDFQEGSAALLYRSITEKIFSLPEDCLVYPAHDYNGRTLSSIGEEKRFNPRLGGSATEQDFVGFMENLGLPHPRQIEVALPANLRSGRPPDGRRIQAADWGPARQNYAGLLEIEADWVASHRRDVNVLDVREREELTGVLGHIERVRWIPLGELKVRSHEVPQDKPVVCVCHAGMRSGQATVILRAAGFQHVANLRGGMVRWNELGLPVERAPLSQ